MQPDDPRHGEYKGAVAHYVEGSAPCGPCLEAAAKYRRDRRVRMYVARTDSLTVPAIGTTRRIQALVALGHTMRAIDEGIGRRYGYTSLKLKRYQDREFRSTADEYAALYDRLHMIRPEGVFADRARAKAAALGWVPPLAWDDIDNDTGPNLPADQLANRGRPVEEVLDEFNFLVKHGGESPEVAAQRLGYALHTIVDNRNRLIRTGRIQKGAA